MIRNITFSLCVCGTYVCLCVEARHQYQVAPSIILHLIFYAVFLTEPTACYVGKIGWSARFRRTAISTFLNEGITNMCSSTWLWHGCQGSELRSPFYAESTSPPDLWVTTILVTYMEIWMLIIWKCVLATLNSENLCHMRMTWGSMIHTSF